MKKEIYYRIDNCSDKFRTLKDAKDYIWINFTPTERIKYFHSTFIERVVNDIVDTLTLINVTDDGGLHYSRPIKERQIYGMNRIFKIKDGKLIKCS